jgi:hypothetical protein
MPSSEIYRLKPEFYIITYTFNIFDYIYKLKQLLKSSGQMQQFFIKDVFLLIFILRLKKQTMKLNFNLTN